MPLLHLNYIAITVHTFAVVIFRFTQENMLFCFIRLDQIISWVSHCYWFIPTKLTAALVHWLFCTTPMYSSTTYNYDATITFFFNCTTISNKWRNN